METTHYPQGEDPRNERSRTEYVQEVNPFPNFETNITDGGEFLDDSLRMIDQPFLQTPKDEQQSAS